jgi:hypothetical protein
VKGLEATSVTDTAGQTLLILDNEHARPQKVLLRKATAVQIETLSPARAGVQITQLTATHGRVKLVVAANSLVALSAPA